MRDAAYEIARQGVTLEISMAERFRLALLGFGRWLAVAVRARADLHALRQLDAHQLADIGLQSSDLDQIERNGFEPRPTRALAAIARQRCETRWACSSNSRSQR